MKHEAKLCTTPQYLAAEVLEVRHGSVEVARLLRRHRINVSFEYEYSEHRVTGYAAKYWAINPEVSLFTTSGF